MTSAFAAVHEQMKMDEKAQIGISTTIDTNTSNTKKRFKDGEKKQKKKKHKKHCHRHQEKEDIASMEIDTADDLLDRNEKILQSLSQKEPPSPIIPIETSPMLPVKISSLAKAVAVAVNENIPTIDIDETSTPTITPSTTEMKTESTTKSIVTPIKYVVPDRLRERGNRVMVLYIDTDTWMSPAWYEAMDHGVDPISGMHIISWKYGKYPDELVSSELIVPFKSLKKIDEQQPYKELKSLVPVGARVLVGSKEFDDPYNGKLTHKNVLFPATIERVMMTEKKRQQDPNQEMIQVEYDCAMWNETKYYCHVGIGSLYHYFGPSRERITELMEQVQQQEQDQEPEQNDQQQQQQQQQQHALALAEAEADADADVDVAMNEMKYTDETKTSTSSQKAGKTDKTNKTGKTSPFISDIEDSSDEVLATGTTLKTPTSTSTSPTSTSTSPSTTTNGKKKSTLLQKKK